MTAAIGRERTVAREKERQSSGRITNGERKRKHETQKPKKENTKRKKCRPKMFFIHDFLFLRIKI